MEYWNGNMDKRTHVNDVDNHFHLMDDECHTFLAL